MANRIGIAALIALPAGWWGGHAMVGLVAFLAAMVVICAMDLARFAFGPWPKAD